MKTQISKRHYQLLMALLGVLFFNYSGYEVAQTGVMESRDLASNSVDDCNLKEKFSKKGAEDKTAVSCKIRIKEGKDRAKVNGEETTFTARMKVWREKKTGEGATQDPSGKIIEGKEAGSGYFYHVRVYVTPEGCELCQEQYEHTAFDSEDHDWESLQEEIKDFGKLYAPKVAKAIVDEAIKAKKAEKDEDKEEKDLQARLEKEENCLIAPGGGEDDDEDDFGTMERLRCNLDRLKDAKKLEDAEDLYEGQIKGDLIEMLTKGTDEERREARGILEGMAKGRIDGSEVKYLRALSIRPSIHFTDMASRAYNRIALAQERVDNAKSPAAEYRANAELINARREADNLLALEVNPANQELLSEDFQVWTKLFEDAGDTSIAGDRRVEKDREEVQNMIIDQIGRQARAIEGDDLFASQSSFDKIRTPSLSLRDGYMNKVEKLTRYGDDFDDDEDYVRGHESRIPRRDSLVRGSK